MRVLFFVILLGLSGSATAQTFTDRSDLLNEQNQNKHFSWAASIADLDGNGLPDIYETGILYLQQDDGTFVSSLPDLGIFYNPLPPPIAGYQGRGVFGSIMADTNDDGFPEFVVLDIIPDSSKIFANQFGLQLTEASPGNGIDFVGLGQGATFGDFNGDGPLDLFFGEELGNNQLFLGDGTGMFTEASIQAGISGTAIQTYGVATTDIDNDGDLDVFIAACSATPSKAHNLLFLNNGDGTFVEIGEAAGINDNLNAWGVNFLDYDRDGWMDIHLANMRINFQDTRPNTNKLYRNLGDGTFEDVSAAAGVEGNDDSYGSSVADFNNDGWPDIYAANFGSAPSLLINNQDGTFTDAFITSGLSDVFANLSIAVGDVNHDGWVDLYTGADAPPFSRLFFNNGGAHHWLTLKLIQEAPNRKAIGARIELWTEGHRQIRDIQAGDGFVSQNMDMSAHFGLGAAVKADSILVRWPDGQTDRWMDVSADQHLTLAKGGGFNEPPLPFRAVSMVTSAAGKKVTGQVAWESSLDPEGASISYTVAVQDPEGRIAHVSDPVAETTYTFDVDTVGVDLSGAWSFVVTATDGMHIRRSTNVGTVLMQGTQTEYEELLADLRISEVWPQPASAMVHLTVESASRQWAQWMLFDIQGRVVREGRQELSGGSDTVSIDGAGLAGGLYHLRLVSSQGMAHRPVLLLGQR